MRQDLAYQSMYAVIFSILLFISACKTPDTENPEPLQKQTLNFAINRPITIVVGTHLANAASGQGEGLITYQSSDPNIASVNSNGVVTGITAGSTTISATIATDEQFQSASASYPLTVTGATATATIQAWVGVEESEITVTSSSDLSGIELYRSSDPDCDLKNYSLCKNGAVDTLTGNPIKDASFTLDRAGFFAFVKGDIKRTHKLSILRARSSTSQRLVYFKEKFWAFGDTFSTKEVWIPGVNLYFDGRRDIWISEDAENWTKTTADQTLFDHDIGNYQITEFQNHLWLVRGDEVWKSDNGTNWLNVTEEAGFSPRKFHQVIVFKNKLWLIGGLGDGAYYNDIWSSADGVTWTKEVAEAEFSARGNHRVAVYSGKLWLVGGEVGQQMLVNDVWSSENGINWQEVSNDIELDTGASHALADFDNKLWLFGRQDIWSTMDGTTWTLMSNGGTTGYASGVVVKDNQLWKIGGRLSKDGSEWQGRTTITPAPTAGNQGRALAFNNKLWIFHKSGIWNSHDGFKWTQQTIGDDFLQTDGTQVILFNNTLWAITGQNFLDSSPNEIWASTDGIKWTQRSTDPPFSPRTNFQLAVFRERLWLIGGSAGENFFNDAWSSSDGLTWTQETANAGFPAREYFKVTAFRNKVWLIGGESDDDQFNDIWSSTNGIDWVQEIEIAPFPKRRQHQLAVFKDKLWLLGGYNYQTSPGGTITRLGNLNDIWSSTDGVQWTKEKASTTEQYTPRYSVSASPFPPSTSHSLVVLNDQLWNLASGGWLVMPSGTYRLSGGIWSSKNGTDWRLGYQMEMDLP